MWMGIGRIEDGGSPNVGSKEVCAASLLSCGVSTVAYARMVLPMLVELSGRAHVRSDDVFAHV